MCPVPGTSLQNKEQESNVSTSLQNEEQESNVSSSRHFTTK